MGAFNARIEVGPDTGDGEHNVSRQLADRPSPTNSPSLFTPNPGHHQASAASELVEARRSAAHLLDSGLRGRAAWQHIGDTS